MGRLIGISNVLRKFPTPGCPYVSLILTQRSSERKEDPNPRFESSHRSQKTATDSKKNSSHPLTGIKKRFVNFHVTEKLATFVILGYYFCDHYVKTIRQGKTNVELHYRNRALMFLKPNGCSPKNPTSYRRLALIPTEKEGNGQNTSARTHFYSTVVPSRNHRDEKERGCSTSRPTQ